MANYHVGWDEETNKIYAGTTNKANTKWTNKSEVTDECLAAVRNHFIVIAEKEKTEKVGYKWDFEDGVSFYLNIEISKKEDKEDKNE